jgi:hypothetical protein
MATSKGRLTKLASVLEQAIDCQVDFEQHPQCLPLGRVKRLLESLRESVQCLRSRLRQEHLLGWFSRHDSGIWLQDGCCDEVKLMMVSCETEVEAGP